MTSTSKIDQEIENIFNQNKLYDLKKFINKRAWLNSTNMVLGYSFHIVQSAGVLTTTIAAGYNMKELVWVGVGMNILASLINVFEKMNASMSKHILKDITAIKKGNYVDEGMLNDGEKNGGDKGAGDKGAGDKTSDKEDEDNEGVTVIKDKLTENLDKERQDLETGLKKMSEININSKPANKALGILSRH